MWANYPSSLPFVERAWKQFRHGWCWIVQCIRHGKRPPAILVWPDMPSRRTALSKITRELGWELTNKKRLSAVIGIKFEDATRKDKASIPHAMNHAISWWNVHCSDISKVNLEIEHQVAFGYGMSCDPTEHQGPIVMKSNENAKHDGVLIQGPIASDDLQKNVVYQREIDNRDKSGCHFDYRVVYIRGAIPVVYKKFKARSTRFTNETIRVELLRDSPFTPAEEQCMQNLAFGMRVDYAEFDALRDRNSNKLYVVDVNPTPWGPPEQLNPYLRKEAVQQMSACLRASI